MKYTFLAIILLFSLLIKAQFISVLSKTNLNCTNSCIGSITFSVGSGVTPPYTAVVSNSSCAISNTIGFSTSTLVINNICECTGDYNFLFFDGNGYFIDIVSTSFHKPELQMFATNTPISCPGECDATAYVISFNGTPPYTYTWSPILVYDDTISDVCPGAYTITGADASGCVGTTQLIIVNNSPNPCVGIEEFNLSKSINIYPNPASSSLFISTEEDDYFKTSEIEIINYLGQNVLKSAFKNEIDLSYLSDGIYSLQIITKNQIVQKRMIIVK